MAAEPPVAEVAADTAPAMVASVPVMTADSPATLITDVNVSGSSVVLQADGNVEIFKFFTLGAPSRLVIDVYGLKAGFKPRQFDIGRDFAKVRVGVYDDKLRFVFDADGDIPDYSVDSQNNNVVVAWGAEADAVASSSKPVVKGVQVNVEAVDFSVEDDASILRVTLNASSALIKPTQKGDIVGFGIKNASISRALRRAVDASSFPSSIRLVTPYTVQVGDQQDVRFAVELKGPSEYELIEEGSVVVFKVVNGPFAEPDPATSQVAVVAPAVMPDSSEMTSPIDSDSVDVDMSSQDAELVDLEAPETAVMEAVEDIAAVTEPLLGGEQVKEYSGQRISLVFDNADIRNILQLIAEVSDLNILAGEGVDGTITLRLIDVPWDQALDLILDTKDLGMIRDGNVAKILPKESIRSMDEAKFTAKRTQEKLEDLVTEVIKISYTDLKNVSAPMKDLLTERGKITEDSRNKQLIVTDIQRNLDKVRELAKILDTPERQVLIEARIVEVATTANLDLGVNWNIFYSQSAQHDGTGNTNGEIGMGGNFVVPAFGAGTGQTAGFGTGFTWGQVGVNTTILDLRLSALETAGEGQVVSNPRVMALNGEKAKISQGTMIPYQTVSADEIKTELVEAALSLEVTPVINPDNSVILTVKATNSSPGTTVATGAGAAPSIDTKEAETKMLVKDGETMVIGGIYVEKDDYSVNGVPILMDIPLLGHLFKSTKTNKNRTELMIFITPRILD